MVDGIEGMGEAVTGGVIARAVEPKAGEARAADDHPATCLNCGAALLGPYCHSCGQSGHVHRTLTAWWHDLAHGVLHLDGKVWRTLPLLAWRPGELTRRYIEGERAKFVSPMALFLFSVFLMFAVFSTLGGPIVVERDAAASEAATAEYEAELESTRDRLAELKAEREELRKAGDPTAGLDKKIESVEGDLKVLTAAGALVGKGAPSTAKQFTEPFKTAPTPGDQDLEADGFQFGEPKLDAAIEKAQENPSLLFYKIQTNAYKFSWALIPISVPFVWLLFFWKRRFRMYDHAVFVTYSIAFMSLGVITLSILRPFGISEGLLILAMIIVPPLHIYRQLKGAYGLTRFGAIWRTILLVNFAFVAGGFFFTLLVMLGALA
ncbi:DUF3667 domain-containing protein [Sphingosinicella humi]|nr:DUF3667 domain-containing protein [Sphingosinicella humi]